MMQPTPAPSSAPNSPKIQPSQGVEAELKAPPQNVDSAPFGILVGLFEKLSNERKHDRRKKLIDAWFNHWRDEKGYDLYPVLRLILPQKDRERAVYGLKEKNLAKIYIKLIPLGMKDPDAIRLLNWKKPTEREVCTPRQHLAVMNMNEIWQKTSGDFPTVLYEVVSKRSSVIEGSLSIDELNDLLDELAQSMGKQEVQSKILQRVYNRSTPTEQRWIVRIILKDMNISVKETTVFAVFHPDAQDLYNTCSDLKKVAYELWDRSYRLNAERPTKKIEDSVKEMGGSEFYIEEKLDGERMQLHKRGNEKGKDYTYLYGKHVGTGSLTPFIDKAFDSRIDQIILDGEMLVWDPVSERNLPFGTLKTAALVYQIGQKRSIILDHAVMHYFLSYSTNINILFEVKVFDLLYLNGQSLLHRSTNFRKKNMRNCLKEITGRIEFAVEYKGKTAKDVRDRMDEVMASRGEGLVIKHPLAKYVLNGRNMDWIKVKPEYMVELYDVLSCAKDNMGETVDVLVVAGNYGSGKRGGGVSTLICAVLDDRRVTDEDEEPKYSSFIRIGSGLSFADYVWVRSKPWKTWDPKRPPAFLLTAKRSHEDKGDVYLEPEECSLNFGRSSFILKVKAAEIVSSGCVHYQYDMGFTMRFPRALAIRDDLSIADCMTATGVLESIRSEKKRKMESDSGVAQKKRKTIAKKPVMLPEYQGPKLRGMAVTSQIFAGKKFVVMSDPKSRTGDEDKKELMKLIHTNGGTCAQIANHPDTIVVYGGRVTPYDLKLLIDKDMCDVLRPEWVIDSVENANLAPLLKKYFFHATTERVDNNDFAEEENEDEKASMSIKPEEDEGNSSSLQAKEESPTPSVKEEQTDEVDPALAEWLKLDLEKENDDVKYESVTDADSDNADVAGEDDDFDYWFSVKKTSTEPATELHPTEPESSTAISPTDVKMGESDNAMEYDQDMIFRHLCFYLDSPDNALQNGLLVKSKLEDLNDSFLELAKKIEENGGKVVSLSEPKLTHVVIDKRDDSRRLELMKRTSKPKRRHLVVSEFIQACLEEETLLDEEDTSILPSPQSLSVPAPPLTISGVFIMTEPQASPISQLLLSLGITREDLMKRSDEMRQFLTASNPGLPHIAETSNAPSGLSVADTRTTSKPLSSQSSFTRSRSRAGSNANRGISPPTTPVKSEPTEVALPGPLRQYGSMEMVIERQRRQNRREKRERRERERESQARLSVPQAPSPTPSNASTRVDPLIKRRVDTDDTASTSQISAPEASSQGDSASAVPTTPQRSRYYREHTDLSSNTYLQPHQVRFFEEEDGLTLNVLYQQTPVKIESPTLTRADPPTQSAPLPQPQYLTYPQYLAYARLLPPLSLPNALAGPSTLPVTPQNQRTYSLRTKFENSPLPPSSPPPTSSPVVTPQRPIVNLVSSPGPMGPPPEEEEYDKLPYTLPPGPYSSNKPDLSYAAIIGQAILSSPKHHLTLQEIYDWITIVYPHFKRGETTWMNSIRHVLSTTVCFRKVPRERSVGRTLWAIWDEDLECFKGGGFRKHLCKDIVESMAARGEQASKNKGKSRKRVDTDDGADARKAKRVKKEPAVSSTTPVATSYMPATLTTHPLFPPTRPTKHHQPYYESCMQPQTLPADVIFPPLPAGVGYSRVPSAATSKTEPSAADAEEISPAAKTDEKQEESNAESAQVTPESTPAAPSSDSVSSLPSLTPNCSSSSPPPASSELDTVSSSVYDVNLDEYIMIGGDSDEEESPAEEEENVFKPSLLSPVKYWGLSPKGLEKQEKQDAPKTTLGAGIKLEFGGVLSAEDDDNQPLWMRSKASLKSPDGRKLNRKISFPPAPASPTLNRKASSHLSKVSKPYTLRKSVDAERATTPTPSTPPRNVRQLPVSSVRTPLSSKGINPAALHSEGDEDDDRAGETEFINRTPRKRVVSSGLAPVTPRRLVFPTNQNDSPFSTPAGGGGGIFSPFRTPGSRSVFDPHDPAALLDEELNRMGAGDSPTGLFGKGRGSLLYDSPGYSTSPGQYGRWQW
ncbi:hypothetical protein H0H92_000794 [Tricholoma furcatifolium]|nr:hypothetical protein H0H92_000794 [Tricholoma furcatifolium]